MQALDDVSVDALRWTQTKRMKRAYELRAGDAVVATLNWTSRSQAVGEWVGGGYRFSFEGWLHPRALISEESAAPATEPMATFARRQRVLTFADGRSFQWKKPTRFTADHVWVDASGRTIARFSPSKGEANVTLADGEQRRAEMPLLLLLGECLFIIEQDEAMVATSAAIVAVIASS